MDDSNLANIKVTYDLRCNAVQPVTLFEEVRLFKGPTGLSQDLLGHQVGGTIANTFPVSCDLHGRTVSWGTGIGKGASLKNRYFPLFWGGEQKAFADSH